MILLLLLPLLRIVVGARMVTDQRNNLTAVPMTAAAAVTLMTVFFSVVLVCLFPVAEPILLLNIDQ